MITKWIKKKKVVAGGVRTRAFTESGIPNSMSVGSQDSRPCARFRKPRVVSLCNPPPTPNPPPSLARLSILVAVE